MNENDRKALLEAIGAGTIPLRDGFDVEAEDVAALARVGAAAVQAGRHDLAQRVFAGLAALCPDEPLHLLHLAVARRAAGDDGGAVQALDGFLASDGPREVEDEIEGLLLRAELLGRVDRARAVQDLSRARALQGGR